MTKLGKKVLKSLPRLLRCARLLGYGGAAFSGLAGALLGGAGLLPVGVLVVIAVLLKMNLAWKTSSTRELTTWEGVKPSL